MNLLVKMLKKKNYLPHHVCEVGVWHPRTSNIKYYIEKDIKTLLIEPDLESIALIEKEWSDKKNLILKTFACTDFEGTIDLHKAGSSSFVSSINNSPAIVNDSFDIKKNVSTKVDAKKFSSEDPGDINLISIDTEGSEWYVIKHMISRPDVISIETHGAYYINPYIEEIKKWMGKHNYALWFKDNDDSVYVKKDVIKINFIELLSLSLKNIHLFFRRYRKGIKLFFRNL
jgi:FkbM family methyltransferase|tara:strand:- start:753 stop:1439 length:687 start_codon:yes stop_codon:yes gene_type:complete